MADPVSASHRCHMLTVALYQCLLTSTSSSSTMNSSPCVQAHACRQGQAWSIPLCFGSTWISFLPCGNWNRRASLWTLSPWVRTIVSNCKSSHCGHLFSSSNINSYVQSQVPIWIVFLETVVCILKGNYHNTILNVMIESKCLP